MTQDLPDAGCGTSQPVGHAPGAGVVQSGQTFHPACLCLYFCFIAATGAGALASRARISLGTASAVLHTMLLHETSICLQRVGEMFFKTFIKTALKL